MQVAVNPPKSSPIVMFPYSQYNALIYGNLFRTSVFWRSIQALLTLPSDRGVDLVGSGWFAKTTLTGLAVAGIILSATAGNIDGACVC